MAFIEVHGLSKSFGSPSRHVLDRVSLTVERGEFVSIVGFMGCGKSTLLNLLAGVTQPDTGAITIDGKPLSGIASRFNTSVASLVNLNNLRNANNLTVGQVLLIP